MKKNIIITFLILIFSIFTFSISYGVDCSYEPGIGDNTDDIITQLSGCIEGSGVVGADEDNPNLNIKESAFSDNINKWANNIAIVLSVLAVGSIVYGAFLLTTSVGEDEKVSKAKDVVKWGIIGFICVISASSIIKVIVAVIYGL